MIAVDTNAVVRLLTRDEDVQFQKAVTLFESHDIFIPDTVILETEWVLRYAYGFGPVDIADAFARLFRLDHVHLANPSIIAQATGWALQGLDFADALHLAQSQACDQLVTFDSRYVKKAQGLCRCTVRKP